MYTMKTINESVSFWKYLLGRKFWNGPNAVVLRMDENGNSWTNPWKDISVSNTTGFFERQKTLLVHRIIWNPQKNFCGFKKNGYMWMGWKIYDQPCRFQRSINVAPCHQEQRTFFSTCYGVLEIDKIKSHISKKRGDHDGREIEKKSNKKEW